MDLFVRRLVERLHDPGQPLTRNRHFHTFETPEGRLALKVARRLRGLQRDILRCAEDGGGTQMSRDAQEHGEPRIEIRLALGRGTRTSYLSPDEFELLLRLPGVSLALGPRQEARVLRGIG